MTKRAVVILLATLMFAASSVAQQPLWHVDFTSTLNNREGGTDLTPDQTFIFTRLTPELGLRLPDADTTRHHDLMGGVSWYQPLNDGGNGYKVLPVLYYRFSDAHSDVAVGAVPRRLMHVSLPTWLWSDSLDYCEPRIRGLLAYHDGERGYMQGMLDWRQMQSTTQREAFDFVASGGVRLVDNFWLTGHFRYNHLAKRRNAPEGEGVNDDMTINPMVGYRHRATTPRGVTWQMDAGAIVQMQRCRAIGDWQKPVAFIGTARLDWRWLEAKETVKAGDDLFPLWNMFGAELNRGDAYYRDSFYSRTDVTAHLVRTSVVDLTTTLSFHATSHTTAFWQDLTCRINIGDLFHTSHRP